MLNLGCLIVAYKIGLGPPIILPTERGIFNDKHHYKILLSRIREILNDILYGIIMMNDDSPENTYEVVKKYADIDIKKEWECQQLK